MFSFRRSKQALEAVVVAHRVSQPDRVVENQYIIAHARKRARTTRSSWVSFPESRASMGK